MFLDYDFRHFNFRLVLYMIALNVIGILVIRSATNMDEDAVARQLMGVLVGLSLAVGLSLIDYHRIVNLAPAIYGGCVAILAAVLIWGRAVNNARRWIEVPVIGQLQPSEFVKIGLIVTFSWYFSKYQEKINRVSTVLIAALLFAVPAFLIFEQPNLSTVLVITVMVLGIVFSSGISYKWVGGTIAVVVPMTATFNICWPLPALPRAARSIICCCAPPPTSMPSWPGPPLCSWGSGSGWPRPIRRCKSGCGWRCT